MKKNILAENMLRFGVKNLNVNNKRQLMEKIEFDVNRDTTVKFNGITYYVWATSDDFDEKDHNAAKEIYKGKSTFNPDDYVVLSKRKLPYGYDMSSAEFKNSDYIVVNSDEVEQDINKDRDRSNFLNRISVGSLEFDGIDHNDAPDYVDAYISYAEFLDGTALNDDQLELLSSYHDWWYDILWDRLH